MSEFEKGETVRITGGQFAGETGKFEYIEHGIAYVKADRWDQTFFAVRESMVDKLDDEDPLKHGMTSSELSRYVYGFINNCTSRIKGVGDEQYSEGGVQKFESMSLDELLTYAQEEVEDIANYAAMLHIRIQRIRHALSDKL